MAMAATKSVLSILSVVELTESTLKVVFIVARLLSPFSMSTASEELSYK